MGCICLRICFCRQTFINSSALLVSLMVLHCTKSRGHSARSCYRTIELKKQVDINKHSIISKLF